MYPVSNAYKQAITANVRDKQSLAGQIILSNDTEIAISDNNIVQGSVTYKAQCVSGSELSVGDVSAAQLEFGLITELENPYNLNGARCTLNYGIITGYSNDGSEEWEYVPLGTFYVTEIERKIGYVQLTLYDSFIKMDVPLGNAVTYGTAASILQSCCANAGIIADLSNISTFPNYDLNVSLPSDNEIETLRDCVMWVCQYLGCFGRINRNGIFELVHLHSESVRTISPDERITGTTVSDTHEKIIQLTMTVGETDYVSGTAGQSMELEENPFFYQLTEEQIQTALDSILNEVTQAEYTPMKCTLFGDPSLMPGDYIVLTDTSSLLGNAISLITDMTWTYRGTHSLTATGGAERTHNNYDQSSKAISALKAVADTARKLALAANDSAEMLNTVIGGNVLIRKKDDSTNEILIMDSIDPAQAVKIWRWNLAGLGYSDNCVGADNPARQYEVAITMDGAVSANFVKTGLLMSLSGTSWINMDSGTFSFGNGALSYDGVAQQLTIGSPNSQIKTIYTAGRISFQQNGIEIAYISGEENKLVIRYVQILETLGIGNFKFVPRANGNVSFK